MLYLKVLAGMPFALPALCEYGASLIHPMLGILPESSLPPQHNGIENTREGPVQIHQAVLHVAHLFFLFSALTCHGSEVLPGTLGLVPPQFEHTLQRKTELLSGHPLPFLRFNAFYVVLLLKAKARPVFWGRRGREERGQK